MAEPLRITRPDMVQPLVCLAVYIGCSLPNSGSHETQIFRNREAFAREHLSTADVEPPLPVLPLQSQHTRSPPLTGELAECLGQTITVILLPAVVDGHQLQFTLAVPEQNLAFDGGQA
ncbi:hypothetical protein D3C80_1414040 [compost metagenome]